MEEIIQNFRILMRPLFGQYITKLNSKPTVFVRAASSRSTGTFFFYLQPVIGSSCKNIGNVTRSSPLQPYLTCLHFATPKEKERKKQDAGRTKERKKERKKVRKKERKIKKERLFKKLEIVRPIGGGTENEFHATIIIIINVVRR